MDPELKALVEQIRNLALRATPGPWQAGTSGGRMDDPNRKPERVVMSRNTNKILAVRDEVTRQSIVDTAYMALVNPKNMEKILDYIETNLKD